MNKIAKLRNVIREVIEEETDYQSLVKTVMDMIGIDSPQELDDDHKAKFFSYLDSLWNPQDGEKRKAPSQSEVDSIFSGVSEMNLNEKKYRVHVITKEGDKFKSKVFHNKKQADDYHWKLAKDNKFKSVDVIPENNRIEEEDYDRDRDAKAMGYRSAAEADADNWGRPKKEAVTEKIEDYKRGDTAHIIKQNKTGMVMKQYGTKVHLKFPNGKEKTYNHSELRKIHDESNNESRYPGNRRTDAHLKEAFYSLGDAMHDLEQAIEFGTSPTTGKPVSGDNALQRIHADIRKSYTKLKSHLDKTYKGWD